MSDGGIAGGGADDGTGARVRLARAGDAEPFVELFAALDVESEFMLYEPGERRLTAEAMRSRIVEGRRSGRETLIVAAREGDSRVGAEPRIRRGDAPDDVAEGSRRSAGNRTADEESGRRGGARTAASAEGPVLEGFAGGFRPSYYRGGHSLNLVLGVRRAASGRGLGARLLAALEADARDLGVHRLGLGVLVTNERAIALYERAGFVHEGRRRAAVRLRSGYVDELFMGKLLR